MGSLTTYAENALLQHVFKIITYVPASTLFVGLGSSVSVEPNPTLLEFTGGEYARQSISFLAASDRQIIQESDIVYPEVTSNLGTIRNYGIFDAAIGGNMLAYGSLEEEKVYEAGKEATIGNGSIVVSVNTGGTSTSYANKLLNFMFRNINLTPATNMYVGITTADISDDDFGDDISELGMTNYVRQLCNSWSAPSGTPRSSSNEIVINFGQLLGDASIMRAGFIIDSASGNGEIIAYANSAVVTTIGSGDIVKYSVGNFIVRMN
jgi:hypothetical protein